MNVFPRSPRSRIFDGRSSGMFMTVTIDGVTYKVKGSEGVRGINVTDALVIRADGTAFTDVLGEVVEATQAQIVPSGVYLALASGSYVVFHDGERWYRGDGLNAVKGINVLDYVTVTEENVTSKMLGPINVSLL